MVANFILNISMIRAGYDMDYLLRYDNNMTLTNIDDIDDTRNICIDIKHKELIT